MLFVLQLNLNMKNITDSDKRNKLLLYLKNSINWLSNDLASGVD